MKKALICFTCIIVITIVVFGVKNINRGKKVENNTTYEESNKNKFVEVEMYKEKEEILYKYTLFNSKGKNVYEETALYREPHIERLENEIIKIGISAGSSVYQVRYFEPMNGKVSEIYYTPWDESNNKLIRFENRKIIIQDMFDKSNYYQEEELNMQDTADPNSAIKSAEFLDANTVKVTYFSEDNNEKITKTIKLKD